MLKSSSWPRMLAASLGLTALLATEAWAQQPPTVRIRGVIEAVGTAEPPGPGQPGIRGHWALPGFIDMHVHGGGGASFTEGDERDASRAAAFHRRHGTTRIIASLVTAPADGSTEWTTGSDR